MQRPSAFLLAALLAVAALPAHAGSGPDLDLSAARLELPPKPRHGRLDSILNGLVEELDRQTRPAEDIARQAALSRGGAVAVTIRTDGETGPLIDFLAERGATVANQASGVIEAYVPLSALAALGEQPGVLAVRSILPPRPLGIVSEGAAKHGALEWQAAGLLGAGIKVGVIDVGFISYAQLTGAEVPAPKGVRCYTGVGAFSSNLSACETGEAHGTAVTEAVVDIAPGVEIYLANPISGLDLLATVQWMASQGVKVINYSVGAGYEGPGDGTSPYSDSQLKSVDAA